MSTFNPFDKNQLGKKEREKVISHSIQTTYVLLEFIFKYTLTEHEKKMIGKIMREAADNNERMEIEDFYGKLLALEKQGDTELSRLIQSFHSLLTK